MDLIERKPLLDYIGSMNMTDKISNEGYVELSNYIDELPSAQPEQRWIPTSECLPRVREWVLCQCRAGIVDVLRLTEDGDWNKNYPHAVYMNGFVIAWMPLPEPYKGEVMK